MPDDGPVQVYYVKAWKSEKDFLNERQPEADFLFHSGEGRALEVNHNVIVPFRDVNELKTSLLRRFKKLEYGYAPPEEWMTALREHRKVYGEALRDQGELEEMKVVVRSGGGDRRWGRKRRGE